MSRTRVRNLFQYEIDIIRLKVEKREHSGMTAGNERQKLEAILILHDQTKKQELKLASCMTLCKMIRL